MGTGCKCRFKSTVGIKYIGARAWHDQPIDRIWPNPNARQTKGQSSVLQAIDHSVAGSMTAQPPRIRPSVLRIATHDQQVGSWFFYPFAEVQSAYSTAPADRALKGLIFFFRNGFFGFDLYFSSYFYLVRDSVGLFFLL